MRSSSFLGVYSVFVAYCSVIATKSGYHGHKVFRVIPENEDELTFLRDFLENSEQQLETWREPTGVSQPVDVHVTPQQLSALVKRLSESGLKHRVIVQDVQSLLESHKDLNREASSNTSRDMFTKYHELDKIYEWLEHMVDSCPSSLHCEVISIGKSYEGRNLPVIKIGTASAPSGGGDKTSVWIDAGIHAREWISTSTALYFTQQLIDGYESDNTIRPLVENHDWYIMPMINPDGNEYTWTTDRLWRKTRSRNGTSQCVGVDANRNFNFKWNTAATSDDPCSSTFPGWAPLTEPETRALAEFIMGHSEEWILYLSLHSYSQLWMAPWGYTTEPPHNYRQLYEGGMVAIEALEAVHGTQYLTGSAANILYRSSGTSRDWAAGVPRILFVYTAELRDTGEYGFVLPPNQIRPTAEETWAGLKALIYYIDTSEVQR